MFVFWSMSLALKMGWKLAIIKVPWTWPCCPEWEWQLPWGQSAENNFTQKGNTQNIISSTHVSQCQGQLTFSNSIIRKTSWSKDLFISLCVCTAVLPAGDGIRVAGATPWWCHWCTAIYDGPKTRLQVRRRLRNTKTAYQKANNTHYLPSSAIIFS